MGNVGLKGSDTMPDMWCNDEAYCMQAIEPGRVSEEIESLLLEKRSESAT